MLLCKNGCDRPVCNSEDLCHVCVRAAGAAEERARIVAMLRAQIEEHQTESRRCYFAEAAAANDKCAAVLDALADRIERGET